jgi:diacylglycerol kinase family enzyme
MLARMSAHLAASPVSDARPLLVVLNAGAGQRDGESACEVIARVLSASGRAHELLTVTGGADALASTLRHASTLATQRDGVLVAAGGDGTINAVARVAIALDRPLGVLPLGTFNYFARALGIPTELDAATRLLLTAQPRPVQVGTVNGELFLVNASLGLYPQLLEDREAFLQRAGRNRVLAVLSSLWLALRGWHQLQVEAEQNGGARRTPTLFVGNNRLQLERLGLDAAQLAALDGQLIGLRVRPISSWAMLGLILRGALGRLGDAEQVERFTFRTLHANPRGRRRLKVAVDGEVLAMRKPITIGIDPRPLQVLQPPPADAPA